MARHIIGIKGNSPAELVANLNAALLPLTANSILSVVYNGGDALRVGGVELSMTITYDDAGATLTDPYQVLIFQASTPAGAAALAAAEIALYPARFWSGAFAVYATNDGRQIQPYSILLVYSLDLTNGMLNWLAGGSGAPPSGAAGGDLSGTYPDPIVVGFQGLGIQGGVPASGTTWVYDSLSGTWKHVAPTRYFVSGAAAQAASPFINGTFVIIFPGSPTSEAGTYQVTANGGAAFPADYTKVSDATDTASEVSIVDVGNYYASTNVEGALQEIGAGTIAGPTGAVAVGTTVIDSVATASIGAAEWFLEFVNGNLRYASTINATHDGATANGIESNVVLGPGLLTLPFTVSVDVSAGAMRLLATSGVAGWTYRARRLTLAA